jgi:signal transduction histidine kinase
MITILIKELSTFISVKIFDNGNGQLPRVRTASSLSHFRTIMREEQAHFKACGLGVRIERENMGLFGSLRWCEIAPLKNS